jgi:hypothetical protein
VQQMVVSRQKVYRKLGGEHAIAEIAKCSTRRLAQDESSWKLGWRDGKMQVRS